MTLVDKCVSEAERTKFVRLPASLNTSKARIFLLVDLREKNFRLRVGGTKKINKKALKMTSLRASFLFFFQSFFPPFFLYSPEKQ